MRAERARERGVSHLLRERAKAMRSAPTAAEHRLWQIVRAKRFADFKFKRQVPIDHYIVDFVCLSRRLIVELDGSQHADNLHDVHRDEDLSLQGFQMLRFWNNELFENEDGVAERILDTLRHSPLPNPSPARGEGLRSAHA